ncbi:TolC family outer membrane protein [Spartinivicinus poritis]|uniref:TolC family outer membrane protein n=1 Tax=Spartinivicinus poritis TaxID=2994640 RepID=A0ABT5UAE0_9GAMM|nr:TolC family outer membrane protein [Spartinivicinus sp. A2-2]MDE1463330.1 TolC family outer membrane protein [Spartinivicinus sp. A2-2]
MRLFVRAGKPLALACSLFYVLPTQAATLEETVAKALDTNPQTLISLQRYRAGTAAIGSAKSGYLPSLDLAAGIGHQRKSSPGTRASGEDNTDFTRRELSLSLRQMIFDGFATSNEVDRTTNENLAQASTLSSTAENVALRVAEVYLNVLEKQQLLELAERNLKTHNRIFQQIRLRAESGVSRSSDLAQITGRRARAKTNVINAKNNLMDAEAEFFRVINLVPAKLVTPRPNQKYMPLNMQAAVKQATENHPTLVSANYDIKAAESQYEASKSPFMPRVDFEVDQAWDRDNDGVHGRDNDLTAMVRMRYNLFNGFADKARKEESAYRVEEARAVKKNAYRQVVEGLKLSWNAYRYLNEQKVSLKQHVNSSRQTVSAYQQQFNIGKRTLLDLLDSENELFQARQAYIEADYDELFSRYRVFNATGQLLPALNVKLPDAWTR